MRNFKLCVSLTLICLIFIFIGAFTPSFINKAEAAGESAKNPIIISSELELQQMRDNINTGNNNSSCYKLSKNLNLSDISNWIPIGTLTHPFTGYFDGNGKIIEDITIVYNSESEQSNLGLFGVISSAEIKNLSVKTNVIVSDGIGQQVLNSVEIGGISGRVINNSIITDCKAEFSLFADRDGKYMGEIVSGGIVGYAEGSIIKQSVIITRINISQDGNNDVDSCFGGAVGSMNGGQMSFVYVAPSSNLIAKIGVKNGALTALNSNDADIILSNLKTSKISFGGLIGYAKSLSLNIYNNVYASLYFTSTPNKIERGGVIGAINGSEKSDNITYSKYLNINSSFIEDFDGAVGNAGAVGYIPSATNSIFTSMPILTFWTEGNWKILKSWDFTSIWKPESIITYSGYFFPNLQAFTSYNIRLSSFNTIEFLGDQYVSGYYKLYFIDASEDPIMDDVNPNLFENDKNFDAGEAVKIKAIFYNDKSVENNLRNFQYYYDFINWACNDIIIVSAENGSVSNGYNVATTEKGKTPQSSIITFNASSATEGIYGINVIGKSVTLKINLSVEEEADEKINFGSIDQVTGSNEKTYLTNFEIEVANYQNGAGNLLRAVDATNSEYIFAQKWVDENNKDNIITNREIIIELDNSKTNTLKKFYPIVAYNSIEDKLIAEITCYFSSNTSELTIQIIGNGSVIINNGEPITQEEHIQSLINDRSTELIATPNDGHQFVGWYSEDVLLSESATYITSIADATVMEARFEESMLIANTGFPIWAIIIIIGILVIGGIIALIVLKIKKNSYRNYKNIGYY